MTVTDSSLVSRNLGFGPPGELNVTGETVIFQNARLTSDSLIQGGDVNVVGETLTFTDTAINASSGPPEGGFGPVTLILPIDPKRHLDIEDREAQAFDTA